MKKSRLTALVLVLAMMLALVVSACGTPAPAPAAPPDSAAPADAAQPADTAAPADGKSEILIGYIAPITGPLANFTKSTEWVEKLCSEKINADGGIYIAAYDKKMPIKVIFGDSESDPTKATDLASKMVLDDKVDILVASCTPDTCSPVAAVCERYEVPGLMFDCPAEPWLTGGPFEWSSAVMFSVLGMMNDYVDAWDKLDTNKKVGFVFDSDVDGITMSGILNELLPERGYEIVDPGRFPSSTTDYTNIITQLKNADCDIIVANQTTPAFTTSWQQFHQLGYIPKVMTIGKAEHFDSDVAALGDMGHGLTSEVHWDKSFPFTSSLLGMTCEELCAKYEEDNGSQFPATIGYDVSCFEVLYDALGRCADLEPATIRDAINSTSIEGVYGAISFNEDRVAIVPCVCCQWLKGETWEYEKVIVGAGDFTIIPTVDPIYIPGYTS